MAKKPLGESRTPTDFWSGMGFSKSMPDHAIRDQLRANNVKYEGPSMPTTYEVSTRDHPCRPLRGDCYGPHILRVSRLTYMDSISSLNCLSYATTNTGRSTTRGAQ